MKWVILLNLIKFKDFIINYGCDGHTRAFQDVSQNLRLCLDYVSDCYTIDELYKLNVKKDCSDTCFSNSNPKICLKTDSCVESCEFCEYKYELNTLCYERCPETSYSSSDNEYLCFDKSPENGYYFDSVKLLYKEIQVIINIRNVIILVKVVIKAVVKQIIIVLNVNQSFIF